MIPFFLLLAIGGLRRSGVSVSVSASASVPVLLGFRMVGLLSDGMGYVSSFYGVGDLESESVSSMVLIIKNPDINFYLGISLIIQLSRHSNQWQHTYASSS